MKTIKIILLAMLAMVLVMGSACKYEEGPALSLRTKTARLTGTWKIEKYIGIDGTESKPDADDNTTWTLGKDNKLTVSAEFFGQPATIDGTWEWINNKEGVRLTLFLSEFDSDTQEFTILRLKNTELWLTEEGGQIHFIPA